MVERRGEGRGSWIQGRSVHNVRIERLWRDLRQFCLQFFIDLFKELEHMNLLNHDDPADIYSLQYIYLPHINQALHKFRNAYNNHRIRTEHNRTPLQIYTQRFYELYHSDYTYINEVLDDVADVNDDYGTDHGDGPVEMDLDNAEPVVTDT